MITEEVIKKASGQYDCKAIQRLRLEWKGFHVINNLDCLGAILELNLGGNEITCISGLDNLVTLQKLNLSHNRISKISNLSALQCLQELNLSANFISSVECFKEISLLRDLRKFRLQGPEREESNPVCGDPAYPATLLLLAPGLTELDGGSVEVLKVFLDVMGSTATGQAAAAICEESYTRPERWIPLDQLSIEGEKACNSGTDDKGKEQSPKKSDAIERAMGSITEKLTVDCPRLLRAGEIAIENATFATIE